MHETPGTSRPLELVLLLVVVEVAPEVFRGELLALVQVIVLGGEGREVEEHVVLGGAEKHVGTVGARRKGGLLLAQRENTLLFGQEGVDLFQHQLDLEVRISRRQFEFQHQAVHFAETQDQVKVVAHTLPDDLGDTCRLEPGVLSQFQLSRQCKRVAALLPVGYGTALCEVHDHVDLLVVRVVDHFQQVYDVWMVQFLQDGYLILYSLQSVAHFRLGCDH